MPKVGWQEYIYTVYIYIVNMHIPTSGWIILSHPPKIIFWIQMNTGRTYIHTSIHTYIHPCIHTYTHTYTHIHTHTDTYTHAYIHTYMTYVCTDMSFLMSQPWDGFEPLPWAGSVALVKPWCHPKCRDWRHQDSYETNQKWGYQGDIVWIYNYMTNIMIFGRV